MRFLIVLALAALALAALGAGGAAAAADPGSCDDGDLDACRRLCEEGDAAACEKLGPGDPARPPTYEEEWATLAPDGAEYVETVAAYPSSPRCASTSDSVVFVAAENADDGFTGCEEETDAAARCVDVYWGFEVRNRPSRWVGWLVGTHTLYRVKQTQHFCFNGARLWEVYGSEYSYDRYGSWYANVFERSHGRQKAFFTWNGRSRGGHWMRSHVHLEGCSFRYGCLHDYHPRFELHTYANGVTRTTILTRS